MSPTTVQIVGIAATFLVATAALLHQILSVPRSRLKISAEWGSSELRGARGHVVFVHDALRVFLANDGDFDELIVEANLIDERGGEFRITSLEGELKRHHGKPWSVEAEWLMEEAEGNGTFKRAVALTGRDRMVTCEVRDIRDDGLLVRTIRRLCGRLGWPLRKIRERRTPRLES